MRLSLKKMSDMRRYLSEHAPIFFQNMHRYSQISVHKYRRNFLSLGYCAILTLIVDSAGPGSYARNKNSRADLSTRAC